MYPPVRKIVERLEERYGRTRHVPRFDPMEELVSCILSQHTTDASSFPAFTRMRAHYADWQAIEDASDAEVADVIRKAGLANQKARSIRACLRAIRLEFGSHTLEPLRAMDWREAKSWLQKLPGVGPKTASIVLCFAFGRPAIPVDTHVFRVSWRLGLVDRSIGEAKAHDLLSALVPEDLAFRFHTALIQHGRLTCKAPKPNCDACPLSDVCPSRAG